MDGSLPLPLPAPPQQRPRRLTDAQVRIIRLTLARACTEAEFDHFIAVAERTGLDPLRRQISAIVLNTADPDKRTMVPLATIDGLRAIAARSGVYRPMEDAPVIAFKEEKKDEALNPLGIVRAEVKVWRAFDGRWFPITGEAWWDEYAAISEFIADRADDRRAKQLAGNWRRMGRVLISKCAEAQALRRGWPEDLSGIYGEEELQRAELEDLLAHERAARAAEDARQRALAGSRSLLIAFEPGAPLEAVPRADVALKLAAFIATAPDAASLEAFEARNREALKTFWECSPGEALDIKAQSERTLLRLRAVASNEEPGAEDGDGAVVERAEEAPPHASSPRRSRRAPRRKRTGARTARKSRRSKADGAPPRPAA